ncbi:DUF4386 domain-containing protein [Nonomuraea candida]|uniref:DUF4386 domain-containing protein n=1 Tax=Nonomuraea candida TaxID=359159 RepID=UPI0005BBA6F0|nr:DUF4386 domain-containing protein [Nonomuraea candida]
MNATRRAASVAGVLVIVGMLAGVLSVVPVLEQPHYLGLVPAHAGQVIIGAAAQLLMIPAYAGFALCLYPALKAVSEPLSLGFLGFRLIAVAFHLAGVILLPLFLVLGEEFARAGAAEAARIEVLGEVVRAARDLVNHAALIISLSLGDLLLFAILHRSRLVPRWLSVWGLLGAGSALAASLLVLFRLTEVVAPLYLAMNAPLALQSLALAVRLIARGLDTRTAVPGPAT